MATRKNEGIRALSELIETADNGALNMEGSQEFRGLIAALEESVRVNGKAKGELTLKFKFDASANGKVEITGEVTSKRPKAPRSKSMAWLNGDALAEADPRQEALPLTGVVAERKGLAPAR